MIRVRNKKILTVGLPILLLLFAADIIYPLIAETARNGKSGVQLNVRSEKGVEGHNTIGIDESALGSARKFLQFGTLGTWDFSVDSHTPCPPNIQELSGQNFDCVGFMYPLQTGEKIKEFCLLRSTQTCCYGPRPEYNQYILVEMEEPVKFERLSPVMVSGKFIVEPVPEDGYIYRMEGTAVTKLGDEAPDIDPAKAAKQAKLALFDYTPLLDMEEKGENEKLSDPLKEQVGEKVVLAGYVVNRKLTGKPRLIVAKSWWDGVGAGTPPTIFNAIVVDIKNNDQAPPLWKPYAVFTGTLRANNDASKRGEDGIVLLTDAVIGVPGVTKPVGSTSAKPLIPWVVKLAMAAAFLLLVFEREPKND